MSTFRRRRGERGASAVEFALVVPLLLAFLVGTVELGMYMKDYVSMSSSVRAGARTASASADAGPGECTPAAPLCSPATAPKFAQLAADTMQTAGTAMNANDIQWVMIYKANTAGLPGGFTDPQNFPAACPANCVKYVWDSGRDKFRYASGSWASASVNACFNVADSVGVALRADHNWMTGLMGSLMGGNKEMTERTVMKFEPLAQDVCGPSSPTPHN